MARPSVSSIANTNKNLTGKQIGTDDIFVGSANQDLIRYYGDTSAEMLGGSLGGNDTITGGANCGNNYSGSEPWNDSGNRLYGDAFSMSGSAQGGNDIITGGTNSRYDYLFGDSYQISGNARGGNDTLTGGQGTKFVSIYGDAVDMYGSASGGNDNLYGSEAAARNVLVGDAYSMYGTNQGGDDYIVGGNNIKPSNTNASGYGYNEMYGDSLELMGGRGGNDTLIGGDNSLNYMVGDSYDLGDYYLGVGNTIGGDDTLIGGGGTAESYLVGDAYDVYGHAKGGNDRLVSGTGTDHMWGDIAPDYSDPANFSFVGGSDVFAFAANNGHDTIYDFESGKDHIEININTGYEEYADLTITVSGDDSIIDLGSGNTVTVIGQTHLTSTDFFFV